MKLFSCSYLEVKLSQLDIGYKREEGQLLNCIIWSLFVRLSWRLVQGFIQDLLLGGGNCGVQ